MDQSEGGYSLAKHPERVGTGPKDKKRLQIQLTWQNPPNHCFPVPPLPGAREGRGSLEGVEIFQMRPIAKRFRPVCRSRCARVGRAAGWRRAVRREFGNIVLEEANPPAAETPLYYFNYMCRLDVTQN